MKLHQSPSGVHAEFARLLTGLDEQDLQFLMNADFYRNQIKKYDHKLRQLVCIGDSLEWPVVWLLSRHSRKHAFVRSCSVTAEHVTKACIDFDHKTRWAWLFRHSTAEKPLLRLRGFATPPYTGPLVAPELNAYLHGLRRTVLQSFTRGRVIAVRSRTNTNWLPLHRLAVRLLAERGLLLAPCDKEAGVVLVTKEDLVAVHSSIVSLPYYRLISEDDAAARVPVLRSSFQQLAEKIALSSGERDYPLLKVLMKPMHEPSAWYVARLKALCKTHKPIPTWRNLHCASASAMLGLSRWLNGKLEAILSRYPHILPTVLSFKLAASGQAIAHDEVLLKTDVKEFFMSGTSQQLTSLIAAAVAGEPDGALITEVTRWLLMNQYLISSELSGTWQVVMGSGMGLSHSSALADLAFYQKTDTMVLQKGFLKGFGIRHYWRYRDDILLVIKAAKVDRFKLLFAARSQPVFHIVFDPAGRQATFLSLNVEATPTGLLQIAPRLRAPAVPLSLSSAHPYHVHRRWPKGYMASLKALATTAKDADAAIQELLTRFRDFHDRPSRLQLLQLDAQQAAQPAARVDEALRSQPCRTRWLPLPYHWSWDRSNLSRKLAEFGKLYECALKQCDWHAPAVVRPAWRVTGQRLVPFVNRIICRHIIIGRRKGMVEALSV